MGSTGRLTESVVTANTMLRTLLITALVASVLGAPKPQLPPGIDPAICPNYPFCGPSPVGAPTQAHSQQSQALLAHQAAEQAVIGRAAQFANGGIVGASGNIGPSGLCGPSGCVAFRR